MEFKKGMRFEVMDGVEKGNVIEITSIYDTMIGKHAKYKVIKKVNEVYGVDEFGLESGFAAHLKPVKANECIVIYRKGDETIALDKRTGKKAVAKCNTDDEYDFITGAKLAFERLTGTGEAKSKSVCILKNKDGTLYGFLGTKTKIKDAIGRELRVGDVVELYTSYNKRLEDSLIVGKEERFFVMGISMDCGNDGTIKNFKIIKKRGYEDVANGEVIRKIQYIKEV